MPTNVSFDKRETSVYQANDVFFSLAELGKQRLAVQRVRGPKQKNQYCTHPAISMIKVDLTICIQQFFYTLPCLVEIGLTSHLTISKFHEC